MPGPDALWNRLHCYIQCSQLEPKAIRERPQGKGKENKGWSRKYRLRISSQTVEMKIKTITKKERMLGGVTLKYGVQFLPTHQMESDPRHTTSEVLA